MTIEEANSNDNEILTEITKRSKAYWGYSAEQMEIWSAVLTITEAYIETNEVYKLILDNKTVGYYSFFHEDEYTLKLDNLFLLPEYIGKGFGQVMMNDLLVKAKNTNANRILLDADPNAENFYAKLGFIKTGQIENATKDRYLPVMALKIDK